MGKFIYILLPFVIAAYFFIKSELDARGFWHKYMPNEMLKLIKQAHQHESFVTDPHVFVGVDMREKLVYPLNIVQAQIIGATQYPVAERNFEYEIIAHSFKKGIFCMDVLITIDYRDTAKSIDLHFHKAPMRLRLQGSVKRGGLELIAVEHD